MNTPNKDRSPQLHGSAGYSVMYYRSDRRQPQAAPARAMSRWWLILALLLIVPGGWLGFSYFSSDAKQGLATSLRHPAALVAVKQPNQCANNTVSKLIIVKISQQHMWACSGDVTVENNAVTTGSTVTVNGITNATPTGTWKIYKKATNQYLTGRNANGSWDDFVHYWMPFNGPYGFHDATWQTFAFGSNQYHTDGSHGCVHLPLPVAQWLYGWVQVGTTVHIES